MKIGRIFLFHCFNVSGMSLLIGGEKTFDFFLRWVGERVCECVCGGEIRREARPSTNLFSTRNGLKKRLGLGLTRACKNVKRSLTTHRLRPA